MCCTPIRFEGQPSPLRSTLHACLHSCSCQSCCPSKPCLGTLLFFCWCLLVGTLLVMCWCPLSLIIICFYSSSSPTTSSTTNSSGAYTQVSHNVSAQICQESARRRSNTSGQGVSKTGKMFPLQVSWSALKWLALTLIISRYGGSGTLQNYDAICLLPLNILNEKL